MYVYSVGIFSTIFGMNIHTEYSPEIFHTKIYHKFLYSIMIVIYTYRSNEVFLYYLFITEDAQVAREVKLQQQKKQQLDEKMHLHLCPVCLHLRSRWCFAEVFVFECHVYVFY